MSRYGIEDPGSMASYEWDSFIDYCTDNDLDPEVEDFDAWREEQNDRADDEAAERWLDYLRERDDY